MTEHARVMRYYYRTRAGHEVLQNTRESCCIITIHARVIRHYYRTRAGHEALLQNAWVVRHYYRTRAGHEALLQNMRGSGGIMTEERKLV